MGAYLSEPITEKVSSDEDNNKLVCGASSMQGWRANQEDAHNTILDYDTNTALFAVYDGHGGAEVALYCAQKLPNYIKETEAYQKGDLSKALEDAFLGFDATIPTPEVMDILKVMAGETNPSGQGNEMDDGSDDENVSTLYSDARLPLQDVLAQYENKLAGIHRARLESTTPLSPCLRAKKNEEAGGSGAGASSSSNDGAAGSSSEPELIEASSSKNGVSNEAEGKTEEDSGGVSSTNNDKDSNGVVSTSEPEAGQTSSMEVDKQTSSAPDSSGDNANLPEQSADAKAPTDNGSGDASNGEVTESKPVGADGDITSSNGGAATPTKGKEKASTVSSSDKPVPNRPKKSQMRRAAAAVYQSILRHATDEDDDDSDSNDENFEGEEASSDDENVNGAAEEKGNEEVEGEVETNDDNTNNTVGNVGGNQGIANVEEKDAEDDDDDEDDNDDDDDDDEPSSTDEEGGDEDISMQEEPGNDSGCTAVVALLRGNELFVANAGDSRCIICREGKAVDMSIDHKPEDAPELERITKAGGKVSNDGRVNGGLNLSRAIGDHSYKLNKELGPREQMITALPDVKTLTIDAATDQFMVIACDGIWNFMSSQDVCDFIVPRLAEGREKLSQICEEMFDHCLAPSTMGDGTGCDNMTAIIVKFKDGAVAEVGSATTEGPKKRAAEDDPSQGEQQDSKRQKVDDPLSSSQVTSSV